MVFLDTNAMIALYEQKKYVPRKAAAAINQNEVALSPMARLELEYLHEIGKIRHEPGSIFAYLERTLHVFIETEGWARAAEIAQVLNWTRDPFDRLIAAHAMVWSAPLLTRDASILEHYSLAFWDEPPV